MDNRIDSFGYWLRRRRKGLDLTQDALAQRVCCSGFTIRKIEADERRPSRHLAERLATALAIPDEERSDFLATARAVRATHRLPSPPAPITTGVHSVTAAISALTPHDSMAFSTNDAVPMVGRHNEYGLLMGLVARLTAGVGYTVLIEGEPGIGKSRLLREIVH